MPPVTRKRAGKPRAPKVIPSHVKVFVDDFNTPFFYGWLSDKDAISIEELICTMTEIPAPPDAESEPNARPRLPEPRLAPIDEEDAMRWVDAILDNTDSDTPEPLAKLLVFLAQYLDGPLRDAFDWLLFAAYRRSSVFYKGHEEFRASVSVGLETVELNKK